MGKAFLVLEDGAVFCGKPFGFPSRRACELLGSPEGEKGAGEVVFNTSMSGYHEMLTDPSYAGQVVVLTCPHAGNYGCRDEWSERGPDSPDLPEVKLTGLVVRMCYSGPVPQGRTTLDAFLKKHRVPGLEEVDTRSLTLHLREKGSCNGLIVTPSKDEPETLSGEDLDAVFAYLRGVPSMEGRNLLSSVGTRKTEEAPIRGGLHFVVVDCGVKGNILRELSRRNVSVTLVPSSADAGAILEANPDGVLFSNGPGDPATLTPVVEAIRSLVGRVPVFGICLGHQMIAWALGGQTKKMKFGHHGVNHPVRDERTGKVQVTSQNHGFEVDGASLPPEVKVWFRNANDGSVEGLYHASLPVLSCQFHPEAAPGPRDSSWIFDEFVKSASAFQCQKEGIPCRQEKI